MSSEKSTESQPAAKTTTSTKTQKTTQKATKKKAAKKKAAKKKASQKVELPSLDYDDMREQLAEWYSHQQRELPWREIKDPYATWVSEIMLQQTRVATVIPYFLRFMERFPTVTELANADLDDVLAQWSGLGYYRRARHLHAGAQEVVERFGGELPANHKELLSIKGIGRYTAGAIASIAFDLPYPAVDGNVYRIFSRIACLDDPVNSPALHRTCEAIASQIVQGESPGDLTQAMMELGALVCTPKSPACLLCPVREHCKAYATGQTLAYPVPKKTTKVRDMTVQWAMLQRDEHILLVQRPADGLFAGLWELPGLYLPHPGPDHTNDLQAHLTSLGLIATLQPEPRHYQHTLSHRRMHIALYQSEAIEGSVSLPPDTFQWVQLDDHPNLPISSITRQVFTSLLREE